MHPNAAVALRVAWKETGLPGLFRGTTSLLAREVRPRPAGAGHELQCEWHLTFTSAFTDNIDMSKHGTQVHIFMGPLISWGRHPRTLLCLFQQI